MNDTDPEHGPATPEQVMQVIQAINESKYCSTCWNCQKEKLDCMDSPKGPMCPHCRWMWKTSGPVRRHPMVKSLEAFQQQLNDRIKEIQEWVNLEMQAMIERELKKQ